MTTPPCGARAARNATTAVSFAAVGLVITLAGCSGGTPASAPAPASEVVRQLGKVPIPSAPAAEPTPTAGPGHPQLLAIGAPVHVTLPGASATVTALGPDVTLPSTGGAGLKSVPGTITLAATVTSGTLSLRAADFSSRDEAGKDVPLAAAGPSVITATGNQPGTLRVTGTFQAGAAQVTWRTGGRVLAIWDFNVELD